MRTYTELSQIPDYESRFRYLFIGGPIGYETFGCDRWINQAFYNSGEWDLVRSEVIARDLGCDMGILSQPISEGKIIVHHMNAITVEDLKERPELVLDPEYLICVSDKTHRQIHYGTIDMKSRELPKERSPNDTCPWKEKSNGI